MNGAVSYTYDPVGNRTQKISTLPGYPGGLTNYNANDQLASDAYDANGNTTASGANTGANGYVYDFENRLIQQGGISVVYDGDGNRVQKAVAGVTTTYLVDTLNPTGYAQVLYETAQGPGVNSDNRAYVYGLERISQQRSFFLNFQNGSTLSYYVYDGHGSVRALADPTGAATDSYDYDAFGNLIHSTGSTPNNYLYSGEQYDPDLHLYYNRARYLNVSTGRFMTSDRSEGLSADPGSLHRYLYAKSDPVDGFDRTGLYTQGFGYAVEAEVAILYLTEFSDSAAFVSFGTQVNDFGIEPGLKPDIFDRRLKQWEDVKPLTVPGIVAANIKATTYFFNYVFDGFQPGRWPRPRSITVQGTPVIIFGTAEGIIFYTDKTQILEQLRLAADVAITVATASRLYQLYLEATATSVVDPLGNLVKIGQTASEGMLQEVQGDVGEATAIQSIAPGT